MYNICDDNNNIGDFFKNHTVLFTICLAPVVFIFFLLFLEGIYSTELYDYRVTYSAKHLNDKTPEYEDRYTKAIDRRIHTIHQIKLNNATNDFNTIYNLNIEYAKFLSNKYNKLNKEIDIKNTICSRCRSKNIVNHISRIKGQLDGQISGSINGNFKNESHVELALILFPFMISSSPKLRGELIGNIEGSIHGIMDTEGIKHCKNCLNEEYYIENITYISKDEYSFKNNLRKFILNEDCYNLDFFKKNLNDINKLTKEQIIFILDNYIYYLRTFKYELSIV